MHGFAEKKAEKLIRVDVDYSDRIDNITISGDFFVHPEELLELVEESVVGIKLSELDSVADRVDAIMNAKNIQLIGITSKDIEEVVREAVKWNGEL